MNRGHISWPRQPATPIDIIGQLTNALADRYRIEREIGAGGMATVYLARDLRHDRQVAIKVLRPELSAVLGAERFLKEIRTVANLQHPHILSLHDSGEANGLVFYVMPFVEGESLRDRLNRETQLPVDDAVRIATEVSNALDYAHRHSVVHRDIKPENILLHDGSAIVADFGIALAVTEAGGERMTQTGLSLGTPSYMSPEQAMGERAITARSDIYSLGVVTYEMLAGEPPFTGPTVQAIVARVMAEEPRSLATQRRSVPPHVAAAVSRALEKVPADRFASAHEFADALNNPSFTPPTTLATLGRSGSSNRQRRTLYGVTALAILMTGTTLWESRRPATSNPVVRYNLALDSAEALSQDATWWGRLALSPDGSRLAYLGGPRAQLLIRPRNQLHATPVPRTEDAQTPFFSPDGQSVGFVTATTSPEVLRIVSLKGGPPITVTDSLVSVAGASWGRDGFIYADGNGPVGLVRVEAKPGAVPKWFTTLDTVSGETDHTWPDVLPNGKGVLFTDSFSAKNATAKPSYAIAVAEIPSGKHRVIVKEAIYARYAASGYLLYVTTNKTLMVVPFDQHSLTVTGEPTALVEGMRVGPAGSTDLAVSEAGTLVYATGAGASRDELVWVTRDGKAQSVDPDWQRGYLEYPALSPDGTRLAVPQSSDGLTSQIWIKQLDRGPAIKLTLEGGINRFPTWTPDGRSVTFSSDAAGSIAFDLWTKRADGSAPAVRQYHKIGRSGRAQWSPDGKWLIFETGQGGADDVVGIRPGIDTLPVPLVVTKYDERSPALSPDGRWLAYVSDESGQNETYVVPFPNTTAAKWAVSSRGGTEPRWSHRGSELFYQSAGKFMAVEVKTNPTFVLGRATELFPTDGFSDNAYAVAPDDRRFLMIRPLTTRTPDKLIVVENWFEELRAKSRK
jgi:serine/threonine-protein kinase